MKTWLIPLSLALLGGHARADQCAWIDEATATKAKTLLKRVDDRGRIAPFVIEFCEPCGDKAPGIPAEAKAVEIRTPEAGYRELYVNGKPVDLAYLFVKTDATTYRNMAALAGCPATGVSPSLSIEAETDDGVLIKADDDALPPPIEPPPPPPTIADPVPVTPVAQPTQVHVYSTTVQELSWPAMLLAACAGFLLGCASTITAFALRRRRSHRARASDL